MNRPRIRTVAAAVTAALLVLAGCSTGSGDPEATHEAAALRLDVAGPSSPMSTPVTATTPADPLVGNRTLHEVTLTLGHCTVEPVTVDGRRWALPWDNQFGWGGGVPTTWQGTGVLEISSRTPDRARYTDRGGIILTLRPASHPITHTPDGWGCD